MGMRGEVISHILGTSGSVETQSKRRAWDGDSKRAMQNLKAYGSEVNHHITGFYSPPRVAEMAIKLSVNPGMSFGLAHADPEDGEA